MARVLTPVPLPPSAAAITRLRPSVSLHFKHLAGNKNNSIPSSSSSSYGEAQRNSRRPRFRLSCFPKAGQPDSTVEAAEEHDEEPPFKVLTALSTMHNDIMVVDTPSSRVLLLDSTHNIHSMLNKDQLWTCSYWDEFAKLPAIIPEGPVAILGLGGGTAAHLLLEVWPHLQLHGWEIDPILIDMAREYFGLSELEKGTQAGGSLSIYIDDALSESAIVQGGFAGIIVDLFADGKIIPQLEEVATWLAIEKKLMPHGRIIVNCGGAHNEEPENGDTKDSRSSTDSWIKNSTVKAMCQAFPGKLSWKRLVDRDNDNYLALTGPTPDLNSWTSRLPSRWSLRVESWTSCDIP